jgi:hypothetical protein
MGKDSLGVHVCPEVVQARRRFRVACVGGQAAIDARLELWQRGERFVVRAQGASIR